MEDDSATRPDDVLLPVPGATRAGADEAALVLASQGITTRIVPASVGYAIAVPEDVEATARRILDHYRDENARASAGSVSEVEPVPLAAAGFVGAYVALVLLASHWLAGHWASTIPIYERGSANASAILAGDWWRTVSALFLHADLAHVIGNSLFGAYFLTAVTRSLGVGLGLLLVVASGALGNALNAVASGHGHDSIGASTAVFGAIGILAGMALARRNRAGQSGARLLLPVGAGIGLLGMLGMGGVRVDVFAHIYGLLAGGLLGIGASLAAPRRPPPWIQLAFGLCALALVALCFALVLRA